MCMYVYTKPLGISYTHTNILVFFPTDGGCFTMEASKKPLYRGALLLGFCEAPIERDFTKHL